MQLRTLRIRYGSLRIIYGSLGMQQIDTDDLSVVSAASVCVTPPLGMQHEWCAWDGFKNNKMTRWHATMFKA